MRGSSYNSGSALTPAGRWRRRNGRVAGSSSPGREEQGRSIVRTTWPPVLRPESGRIYRPWTLFEEWMWTEPFSLRRFPSQPRTPVRTLVLDTDVFGGGGGDGGEADPALRMVVRNYSQPRIGGEWHLQVEAEPEEDPGLTAEEFKKAMKKMRKHVHNHIYPRRTAWLMRGLFSGRSAAAAAAVAGEAEDGYRVEESKDCAVCLETFGANEQVLMTPCNHMFHGGCIVPWVKSRGQCPVCRLELCERSQQDRRRRQRFNGGGEGWDDESSYLVTAVEAAFNWINLTR